MNTKEKILDKALEMFNERGIEYVGLRELAAVLEMRVGNISYYFPTKDDLVYELALELSHSNSELIKIRESLTMYNFLDMLRLVFQNQLKYRCLLLSVVHLMRQNKSMEQSYRKTQNNRNAALTSNLETLVDGAYLIVQDEQQMAFLVSGISLVSRFWISEAAISLQGMSATEQIRRYMEYVTKFLMPYSTPKAKKEMRNFLETART